MSTLLRTPLYETHRRLGARMVEFAGFEMPVQYSSILEEHAAVRQRAGLFDVSHMGQIELEGPAAITAAERLLTRPVASLAVGRVRYGLLCNPEGGVIDDVTFYRLAPQALLLCVNASNIEKDWRWIAGHAPAAAGARNRSDETGLLALQGPLALDVLRRVSAPPEAKLPRWGFARFEVAGRPALVSRTGYTGSDGFEIYLPASDVVAVFEALLDRGAPLGLEPVGLGARDTLRLEAGMNLYGQDMDETASPLESGLAWTVDLKTERDFVGRKALESSEVTKQLAGMLLLDKGVLRSHQKVHTKNGDGEITSGTFSPTLQQSIALARIPLGIAPGEEVEVEIRDKKLKAKVVKYPFVRNGKALI
jgi:aminomethyltransferase